MIAEDIIMTPEDQEAVERLSSFIPEKVFDMHMHIGTQESCPAFITPQNGAWYAGGAELTFDQYLKDEGRFFPNVKKLRANMIAIPDRAQRDTALRDKLAQFVARELDKHPECVGEVMVLATDTKEDIEKQLIHPGIRGFKCYHLTANTDKDTFLCNTEEFLPEGAWQVASERNMCITLHMVKPMALADPDNIEYICRMAAKYPKARLILAHAARGFAPWTVEDNISKLAQYENVYFDLSAVCEPDAMFTIIKTCGHKRVFWGSDYAVSMLRGKCVSLGPNFLWLYKEQLALCESPTAFTPYLIGIECLIAMERACRYLNLSKAQVEDIFYNNAMEFFGLTD